MKRLKFTLIGICLLSSTITVFANENEEGWFLRPIFSLSNLSDTTGAISGSSQSGTVEITTDSGFSAGLGLGYQYNQNVAVEIFWEYRTNDSNTTFADGTSFTGNYASNVFFLNGFYYFDSGSKSNWQTYIGAGIGWVQEIDLDIESMGSEESFSGDGQSATQLFVGTEYNLTKDLDIQLELRYGNISSIDMNNESTNIPLNGLDYKTTSIQVGFVYQF